MAEVKVLFAATADGIAQFVNPGTSQRWRPVGRSLEGHDVLSVAISRFDPLQAVAGTSVGAFATSDGGATWRPFGNYIITALTATEPDLFWAGTDDWWVLLRNNGGWDRLQRGPAPVRYIGDLPRGRIAVMYADGSLDMFTEGDWLSSPELPRPIISTVVSSFTRPDDLFFVTAGGLATPGGIRPVEAEPTGALLMLAGDPEVLLIGTRAGIMRSDDAGASINTVEGPQDVQVLISPPRYQDHVYAGTAAGELWVSTDRGRTWALLHDALPPVRDVDFARLR